MALIFFSLPISSTVVSRTRGESIQSRSFLDESWQLYQKASTDAGVQSTEAFFIHRQVRIMGIISCLYVSLVDGESVIDVCKK